MKKYKVVALRGSTRFKDQFKEGSDNRAAAEILLRYFEAGANERNFVRTYRLG